MALDNIQKDLENLRAAVPELKGVLLASMEGKPLAHSLSQEVDPYRIAAMAAAASSLGRRVSDSLSVGTLNEISLSGSEGQVFLYNAGGKAVLAVIGPTGANTGLIHLEARWAAREIGERV
ncbi:MAG TPA: roadblock/LC7 domain-containing protein [Bryobacteraceae bacterium]|nr:roadblock/LC7 domain-containing protein [Bryobacteraceae bacterium]